MAKRIEIETMKFQASHGRKPKGRGGWAFLVMDASLGYRAEPVDTIWVPGYNTLGDAKVWIKAHVRATMAEAVESGNLYLEVAP